MSESNDEPLLIDMLEACRAVASYVEGLVANNPEIYSSPFYASRTDRKGTWVGELLTASITRSHAQWHGALLSYSTDDYLHGIDQLDQRLS